MSNLPGLTFHAHGYQIHGEGITATNVANYNALSNIEALGATRLLEIWFQQQLLSHTVSIRLGQMAVDTEFILADGAGQFISATFGWPTIASANLPNGGSAYPLSAPAARLELTPTPTTALRLAVFNDDPSGPCDVDPQECNPHGLEFRLSDDAYAISEAEIKYNQGQFSGWLPGTLKLGAWVDFATFEDLRFGTDGLSLADPASAGEPRLHDLNYAVYAIVDQQLYRLPGDDASKGISMFARIMGAPSDRNLVDLYIDGGVTFSGFWGARPRDSFGVAAAYAGVSDQARDVDHDAAFFGSLGPIRGNEVLVEASYIAEIVPGWTLQPDIQYVWNPGGNVADDSGVNVIEDALIIGLRTSLNY